MSRPLEETFAGSVGRWRVVDKGGEEARGHERRFAVMAVPINLPNEPHFEFELCAVQYRPHAEAIAALPETWAAVDALCAAITRTHGVSACRDTVRAAEEAARIAVAKAEGRGA